MLFITANLARFTALDPEDAQTIGETGVFTVEEQAEGLLAVTTDAGTSYVYVRSKGGVQ